MIEHHRKVHLEFLDLVKHALPDEHWQPQRLISCELPTHYEISNAHRLPVVQWAKCKQPYPRVLFTQLFPAIADNSCMTLPRQVMPGRDYMITRDPRQRTEGRFESSSVRNPDA
jgi:hypothetical protein